MGDDEGESAEGEMPCGNTPWGTIFSFDVILFALGEQRHSGHFCSIYSCAPELPHLM